MLLLLLQMLLLLLVMMMESGAAAATVAIVFGIFVVVGVAGRGRTAGVRGDQMTPPTAIGISVTAVSVPESYYYQFHIVVRR